VHHLDPFHKTVVRAVISLSPASKPFCEFSRVSMCKIHLMLARELSRWKVRG
jgi:hypothetical protein